MDCQGHHLPPPSPTAALQWRLEHLAREDKGRSVFKASKSDDNYPRSGASSFTAVDPTGIDDLPLLSRMAQHLTEEVDTKWTDMILIICSFVSGVIDSMAFNAWGSFANMQTGNTVFLALGVSGQPPYPEFLWAKSLIAIVAFMLGILFFFHASRVLTPLRRSTLLASFSLQTLALIAAGVLVQTGIVEAKREDPRGPIHWMQIVPLVLLSLQAAGQIVTSRVLYLDEVPTVVLTTVLCDFLIDPQLVSTKRGWHTHAMRNRRLATFVALFAGAMVSGGLTKAAGLASSLWLAAGLKFVVTILWLFWKGKIQDEGDFV
ncbi:hypothetical protein AJ80_02029 [Polytolypa hystricis UAMH7299]|uniref:DUF1275 domain-containing protein n=1 Tax=Polytolypa hystricis (strain UAMH7299) TaxID=1447883 RepID=A0A2B7YTK4_POLH7|nr:hypothetical protein AJ80_02029 [Polytolypa hystricis UAMH7299]